MKCRIARHDDTATATLSGSFIFSDHTAFRDVLACVENNEVKRLMVDLAALEFIDSAGLGMLLLLRDLCNKQKCVLKLLNPTGQVSKVFGISRFEHLFIIEG